MARPSDSKEFALFLKPPLLITESEEDFASLIAAMERDVKPSGMVERIYAADIAALLWEIWRLRRCKTAIVNAAFEGALYNILRRLTAADQDAQDAVVSGWLEDPTERERCRNYSLNIISTSPPSKRKQSKAFPRSSR